MNNRAAESASPTIRIATWDPWVRIVHWTIVLLFGLSWWSAETGRTSLHLWSGYGFLAVLLFRLLWGFVGSSTARFNSFVRGPKGVLGYLSRARDWRFVGHTPLGALSVLTMLILLSLQVAMGLILIDDEGIDSGPLMPLVDPETSDIAFQLHRQLFTLLQWFVVLHLGAILFYRLLRGRGLTSAMITGAGEYPPGTEPMQPAPARRALLCLATALALTAWVIAGVPPFGS